MPDVVEDAIGGGTCVGCIHDVSMMAGRKVAGKPRASLCGAFHPSATRRAALLVSRRCSSAGALRTDRWSPTHCSARTLDEACVKRVRTELAGSAREHPAQRVD